MKITLTFTIFIFLFSCENSNYRKNADWKTIEIGNYLFDFPPDFFLIPKQGIDSYVGLIKGDSIEFCFDFGYYSNDMGPTKDQFLKNGIWRMDLPLRFMKEGIQYDATNMPKVEVLALRKATAKDSLIGKGCDYVAECKHQTTYFDYPVFIPEEIKQSEFEIDTVDGQYRKMVIAKNSRAGITGVYLRNLEAPNTDVNLSMSTTNLSPGQQKTALTIFKTGRLKAARM